MKCPYCGAANEIESATIAVPLLDFVSYANAEASAGNIHETLTVRCGSCGAQTKMEADTVAGKCAFCGSPLVAEAQSQKLIKPIGVLPFIITKQQANEAFRRWVASLWFAPGSLVRQSELAGIDGAYIPGWTYNSDTITQYTGMRGDDYQEMETYTYFVNGRMQTGQRMVTKTRWSPAAGMVPNRFRDLLVLATQSLPPNLTAHLQPWDLNHLVPYSDQFISGMACQSYQLGLSGGFDQAKGQQMAPIIHQTICRDIGGNHQQITSANTQYHNIQFRHILLPLWISAYRYSNKTYRFLVNARTGAIRGERPWSAAKIAILSTVILAILIIIYWLTQH
jgi:hypothetical protein